MSLGIAPSLLAQPGTAPLNGAFPARVTARGHWDTVSPLSPGCTAPRELTWGQGAVPCCWESQGSARGSPRAEVGVAAVLLQGDGRGHPCKPKPGRGPLQPLGERLFRQISCFSTEVDDFISHTPACHPPTPPVPDFGICSSTTPTHHAALVLPTRLGCCSWSSSRRIPIFPVAAVRKWPRFHQELCKAFECRASRAPSSAAPDGPVLGRLARSESSFATLISQHC